MLVYVTLVALPAFFVRYQNVWMYVLHELEDAVNDCNAGGDNPVSVFTGTASRIEVRC